MKKNDWYIAAGVIGAAMLWWGIQTFVLSSDGTEFVVKQNGELIGSYSLSEDEELTFYSDGGKKNVVEIKDGQARMKEADCPDKLCIKQKAISKKGESIICLPHKLTLEVTGGEERELDALVQ